MEIWLRGEDASIQLPVLPREFNLQGGASIDSASIVKRGEVDIYNGATLKTATLESFFPKNYAPYCSTWSFLDPYTYADIIQKWHDKGSVIRYIVTGTNINIEMRVKSFEYREQDGTGDVYYSIGLLEHKKIYFTKSKIADALLITNTNQSQRPAKPTTSTTKRYHTVEPGDSLWSLAKKYYGKGSDWNKIYNANKDQVKNPDLILDGWKLVIP